MHVRDLDALDHAERRSRAQRGARVVGVDVRLERRRVADDEERVAERREPPLERGSPRAVALDDEDRAVAVAGGLLVDRLRGERLGLDRLRQRLAGDVGRDAADDLDEPGATCVDDAGLAQDFELVSRLLDSLVAAADEAARSSGSSRPGSRPPPPRRARGSRSGSSPRRARGRPRTPRRRRALSAVATEPSSCEALDRAANDLRQDHARVAAGPEQRRVGDLVGRSPSDSSALPRRRAR